MVTMIIIIITTAMTLLPLIMIISKKLEIYNLG